MLKQQHEVSLTNDVKHTSVGTEATEQSQKFDINTGTIHTTEHIQCGQDCTVLQCSA